MAVAAGTTVARVANPAEQAVLAVAYATMEGNEARNESLEVITRELATFPERFQSVIDRIELMSEQMAALKEENAALRGRFEASEEARVAERAEMDARIGRIMEKFERHIAHLEKLVVPTYTYVSRERAGPSHWDRGTGHILAADGITSVKYEG